MPFWPYICVFDVRDSANAGDNERYFHVRIYSANRRRTTDRKQKAMTAVPIASLKAKFFARFKNILILEIYFLTIVL